MIETRVGERMIHARGGERMIETCGGERMIETRVEKYRSKRALEND